MPIADLTYRVPRLVFGALELIRYMPSLVGADDWLEQLRNWKNVKQPLNCQRQHQQKS